MKVFEEKNGLLLRVDLGEEVPAVIESLWEERGYPSAFLAGIGALRWAELGYWDPNEERYVSNRFDAQLEVISFLGNISFKEGKPFLHAHVSLGDKKGGVVGGHLLKGEAFLLELRCVFVEGKVKRERDGEFPLPVWKEMIKGE